jgi:hypothetical protein
MYLRSLNWNKCEGSKWCPLLTVDLQHSNFEGVAGVYIIWHGGQKPWTVYVGQGDIADRLAEHRRDSRILQYSSLGLFVTWAKVSSELRPGIESFLAEKLHPREGDAHPVASPISVNFPW